MKKKRNKVTKNIMNELPKDYVEAVKALKIYKLMNNLTYEQLGTKLNITTVWVFKIMKFQEKPSERMIFNIKRFLNMPQVDIDT